MNFADLKSELAARGFDYLSDTRRGQYINWARAELDEIELWPYRQKTASGAAPLAVSDLGSVEQVTNSSGPLDPMDYGDLVASFGDLSTDGQPSYFYVDWPSGVGTVTVFPESAGSITVRYWRVTPDLTGTETPAAPARFHKLIVDMAAREAYRDSDNHAAAEGLQAQIERDLARMRNVLFSDQLQGPGFVRIVAGSGDW